LRPLGEAGARVRDVAHDQIHGHPDVLLAVGELRLAAEGALAPGEEAEDRPRDDEGDHQGDRELDEAEALLVRSRGARHDALLGIAPVPNPGAHGHPRAVLVHVRKVVNSAREREIESTPVPSDLTRMKSTSGSPVPTICHRVWIRPTPGRSSSRL